ncbi:MAG: VanZ family protein [Bacteroidaceae bacterium]|nr:VanZ family protein [Bacteroidaceae bacterium]
MKLNRNTPYLLSTITSFAIIIISLIPIPEVKPLHEVPLADKWVHFVMYGGLALCLWFDWYMKNGTERLQPISLLIAFVYPIVLGGLMELGQAYLTTCRSGDMIDFYANTIGAFLGLVLGTTVVRQISKRTRTKN